MQWSTIEDQIWTWVQGKSGLSADHVIWAAQNSPRPSSNPYITLNIRTVDTLGEDWVKVDPNPSPAAGAEILYQVRGMRRCALDVTCYGDTSIGSGGPVSILTTLVAALRLPSVADAMSAIGISDIGTIQMIPGLRGGTLLEPRAILPITFFATSELVETGTYIEHAVITREDPNPDLTFTV